ncbi:hypothetical protein K438DRAFT_1756717 [Mycena galopus ATCC 62051]|nr:hypothetical protein K438DRAFT_1756717 [Mycena galopus ATCC 62051]
MAQNSFSPRAWKAEDVRRDSSWILRLSVEEVDGFRVAPFLTGTIHSSCLLFSHQFTSKATTTSKNKKTSKKRRHLADDDDTTFISAVLKELGYGSSISHVMEEAKLITTMPSDLPNTIPAIKKRLYQFMVEIAVINDRVRSDLALRTAHIEDAAGLTARLTELEGSPAEN